MTVQRPKSEVQSFPKESREFADGFTLIELLVVIAIIGSAAADEARQD